MNTNVFDRDFFDIANEDIAIYENGTSNAFKLDANIRKIGKEIQNMGTPGHPICYPVSNLISAKGHSGYDTSGSAWAVYEIPLSSSAYNASVVLAKDKAFYTSMYHKMEVSKNVKTKDPKYIAEKAYYNELNKYINIVEDLNHTYGNQHQFILFHCSIELLSGANSDESLYDAMKKSLEKKLGFKIPSLSETIIEKLAKNMSPKNAYIILVNMPLNPVKMYKS